MSDDYSLTTLKTWSETKNELAREFRLWSVAEWTIDCMLSPASAARLIQMPEERMVELHYLLNDQPFHLRMNKQHRAVDNLRVLFLAIKAMRLNDLRGLTDTIQQAYLQLPSPATKRDPYEILGIRPDSTLEFAEMVYLGLAKKFHPDNGGDAKQMQQINEAIEDIRNRHKVEATV